MNMLRLYHTLRPLRAVQWTDRLLRPVKAFFPRKKKLPARHLANAINLPQTELPRFVTTDTFDPATGQATLLNISHLFNRDAVDWNCGDHGKLWAYHLNYFGWLEGMEDVAGASELMQDFCRRADATGVGGEPYPASRRIQHWIGALLRHERRDAEVLRRLYADAHRVASMPEYHLQGNHLLQNGFAIFAAAHFFGDDSLYRCARRVLRKELASQIFADGAHIERSASYTADLCARAVWCLHLQRATRRFTDVELTQQLRGAATGMLSWLSSYAFSDDSLAAIGDSSPDMMPAISALREAASSLAISTERQPSGESGYRKASGKEWEAVINFGAPSPAWQPGHSHADTLTFCVYAHGRPLLVDTGISTYERSARRALERGTAAHNTVTVESENSSDVWASFRMGRRAKAQLLADGPTRVTAGHDGYRALGVRHQRTFDWTDERALRIEDEFQGAGSRAILSFLHFHPDVLLARLSEEEWRANDCRLLFCGMASVIAEPYQYAAGFNLLRPAMRLKCIPQKTTTEIQVLF